jgi:signal transduction histidine kinase
MEPSQALIEREAAILQAAVTIGLALLFGLLYRRYRRPHFLWWSVAWQLYTIRVALIVTFLGTRDSTWLYLHQAATGWTALAILAAALSFERRRPFRPVVVVAAAVVPVVWAYLTIYVLESFLLAATLTVLLLAGATIWTGLVFLRFRRRTGSVSAGFVAGTLLLWGLHHLDYPLLRAQGLLAPWSYYIDVVLILALSVGVLLLVMEEIQRGLRTLSALSGDLHRPPDEDRAPALLERALGLAGVTGGALWAPDPAPAGRFTHSIGICAAWRDTAPGGELHAAIRGAMESGRPILLADRELHVGDRTEQVAFAGVLPVLREPRGVAVLTGPARAPFTALDEDYLVALGQQIGAALQNADLSRRLRDRTAQLERLSLRLIHQHEDQRRRLARELHDETAQVFSAMKLQLGLLGESAGPGAQTRVGVLRGLVEAGMESIRSVAEDLRPPLLDDLGLGAALQALVSDYRDRSGTEATFETPGPLPPLGDDAELALFRTLQEALANVARHADARRVEVTCRRRRARCRW